MSVTLRLLLVEDNADDADLVVRRLTKAGHDVVVERVDSADTFVKALEQHAWDVIICDHVVPGFGSDAALRIVQARNLGIPFIVVSGHIGEEAAVDALKAGADDYVMKDRLARLPEAVTRAIAHRTLERRQRQHDAEVQRAQTMEALGTLAAGIAHDVNNILTAILVNAQLAQMATRESSTNEHLEQVCLAAERGRELVQRTLAFGRPDEGRRILVQPLGVVNEVAALARAGVPPGVDLRIESADGVPGVVADPTQLFQVVMNLATNALQAIESGTGTVTIHLDEVTLSDEHEPVASIPHGRYLRIRVADNGRGMSPATASRVFEPFFTTRSGGQGSGLGLAAVHQIVRHHGGAVAVSSALGQGSTFSVYLPAAAEHDVPIGLTEPRSAATMSQPSGDGRHVLYVEDEFLVSLATTRYLRSIGYTVTDVRTGREALELLLADIYRFDVVLTDQNLPGMSGAELARIVGQLRGDLPFVLTSGVNPGEAALALPNTRQWLAKPYTDQALGQAVLRALASRPRPAGTV
ncbi:MAG: response regulator [Vicinamibacterales bacterium]